MLLHPDLGSFFFIGTVLTTADLEPDAPLARPLWQLHALPRRVPHGRVRRPLRAGRPALHLVPHDRAPGADSRRAQVRRGRVDVRLRRMPDGLPLERPRPRDRRAGVRAAPASVTGRAPRPRRSRVPRELPREPAQAGAARGARPQRSGRARQRRNARRRAGAAAGPGACRARRPRPCRVGARPDRRGGGARRPSRRASPAKPTPTPSRRWNARWGSCPGWTPRKGGCTHEDRSGSGRAGRGRPPERFLPGRSARRQGRATPSCPS